MTIVFRLPPSAAERVAFSYSPALEAVRSLHVLVEPKHHPVLAHVRRSGSPRGAHDLIIAAHAAETGWMILSRDAKARFGDLPGVSAIDM